MSRWFRFYDGALDDPKVQALPADLFKVWVNLLCVASRNEGRLPVADLPFMLRMSAEAVNVALSGLSAAGLLDRDEDGAAPHNWDARQFKSDTSNERVKQHRERKRNTTSNDGVTLHETPPETETDTEAERGCARATRLPENWEPTDAQRATAIASGIPADRLDGVVSKFKNNAFSATGRKALSMDWGANWSTWVIREREMHSYRPSIYVPVVGTVPSVAIGVKDPRWKSCADRWEREYGKPPKPVPSSAFPEGSKLFPSDWEETRISSAVAAA